MHVRTLQITPWNLRSGTRIGNLDITDLAGATTELRTANIEGVYPREKPSHSVMIPPNRFKTWRLFPRHRPVAPRARSP